MSIDLKELAKQNKEEMLKGKYIRHEIIIGEDNPMPWCNTEMHGVTPIEVAKLILVFEREIKMLREKYPMVDFIKKGFITKDVDTIETDKRWD